MYNKFKRIAMVLIFIAVATITFNFMMHFHDAQPGIYSVMILPDDPWYGAFKDPENAIVEVKQDGSATLYDGGDTSSVWVIGDDSVAYIVYNWGGIGDVRLERISP